MSAAIDCLDENTVVAFLERQLSEAQTLSIEHHIDGCPTCRVLLAAMAKLVDPTAPAPLRLPVLETGTPVGRYLVLEKVGSGGMGVVYAAYDPQLSRKVALKLLRPSDTPADREPERIRALREAQSMASVTHPNVITVHDVGTFEGEVFIAMELVEGQSLNQWLRATPRPWSLVLATFLKAGRGLAAAHRAGLVHRDFKPDNVLLGRDGRVLVTDFGLAHQPVDAITPALTGQSRVASTLTRTGARVGTPAYMSPEQHRGAPTTAQSDQFSFCVALYEGLYGERPFAGLAIDPLNEAIDQGRVRPAPKSSPVPRWVRALLLRGLKANPMERFPQIDVLLDALESAPRVRRRAKMAAAIALVIVAGAAALVQRLNARAALCLQGGRRLTGIWDADRQRAIEQALLATHLPYAADAWAGTARALNAYSSDWLAMHREACEATRIRGEQSDEVLSLRMQCLDHRLSELRTLSNLLTTADPAMAERATQSAFGLSEVSDCAEVDALLASRAKPKHGDEERVEQVRQQIEQARVLLRLGKYDTARTQALEGAAGARKVQFAPLIAEALFELGNAQSATAEAEEAAKTLYEAADLAAMARDDRMLANVWMQLSTVLGVDLAKPELGHAWARAAAAAIARHGGDGALEATLAQKLGQLASREGNLNESLLQRRRALALRKKLYGDDDPLVAKVHSGLGKALAQLGQFDEAVIEYQRALDANAKTVGTSHPEYARSLGGLGAVFYERGNFEQAVQTLSKSLAIDEATLPADHPWIASSLNNLGLALKDAGRPREALPLLERSIALVEKRRGPDHPDVLESRANAALIRADLGQEHEALQQLQLAASGLERVVPDSPLVALVLYEWADQLRRFGQASNALAPLQKALGIQQKLPGGANARDLGDVWVAIGLCQLSLGHFEQAESALVRGLEIRQSQPNETTRLATARFALAQAIWKKDPSHALKLASQAQSGWGPKEQPQLDNVREWLKKHAR
jgi:tetratricopeptide (TPR) repeat protein